jgi:EAL domain-containing protein (putative c-di-GMP-specific phosphodiesterase class I)
MGVKLQHYLVRHADAIAKLNAAARATANSGPLRRFGGTFKADSDIVAASHAGRKVRVVSSYQHRLTLAPAVHRRLRLETDLRRAIENSKLTLYYQAQFEVGNGAACGIEALARWFRCDGTAIEPCVFIPLAEGAHLIGALGSWVLQEACKAVHEWRSPGLDSLILCVNVSPHQLDHTLVGVVQRTLERTGFPAERLELEITESALIADGAAIIDCFRQLKEMGVGIAIDDFGTGYSSLSYLSRLPVDRLKLDKSLVHNLNCQWKDVAIVRSIIALGKELGIAVIAEGVETEQQFQMLKQLGCQQVQGYLFARPAPESVANGILTRRWGMRLTAPIDAIGTLPRRLNAS